ncbi:MAG: SpoIIE family protein phosphatase, partial [Bacteroidetes bacterium]|nr:SpoIIE family protein phosphatase [Bacteroidota bacterium]
QSVPLGAGDVLVIYSDGISEAINPGQEQFGDEHISAVIEAHRKQSASQIMNEIIAAVKAHAGTAPQMDDMTLVVVKGTG